MSLLVPQLILLVSHRGAFSKCALGDETWRAPEKDPMRLEEIRSDAFHGPHEAIPRVNTEGHPCRMGPLRVRQLYYPANRLHLLRGRERSVMALAKLSTTRSSTMGAQAPMLGSSSGAPSLPVEFRESLGESLPLPLRFTTVGLPLGVLAPDSQPELDLNAAKDSFELPDCPIRALTFSLQACLVREQLQGCSRLPARVHDCLLSSVAPSRKRSHSSKS